MRVNGLWKFNQGGFKADHRTEDDHFILNIIYEKYINMENKQNSLYGLCWLFKILW